MLGDSEHFLSSFTGGAVLYRIVLRVGERPISNLRREEANHWCSQRGFQILDTSLCFENEAIMRLNFAHFDLFPVKVCGRMCEVSDSYTRCAPGGCFRFPVCCSTAKPERYKSGQICNIRMHTNCFQLPIKILKLSVDQRSYFPIRFGYFGNRWTFFAIFLLRMCRNCYFWACGMTSPLNLRN